MRETSDYEFVRRVLGHKNIQTTINFYIGLETTDANRRFGDIVGHTSSGRIGRDPLVAHLRLAQADRRAPGSTPANQVSDYGVAVAPPT